MGRIEAVHVEIGREDIAGVHRQIVRGIAHHDGIQHLVRGKTRGLAEGYCVGGQGIQTVDNAVAVDVAKVGIDVDAARAKPARDRAIVDGDGAELEKFLVLV